ncbi:MAG: signal peptidase II [Candidatus Curtissbacteria bacterium]
MSKAKFASSYNSGIAFGILQSLGTFNTIAAIVVVWACFYFLTREKRAVASFALALIVGGGLSNIVDRLALGGVRDFIDIGFWPSQTWLSSSLTRWPSFNLADSAVTIGVIILIFAILRRHSGEQSDSRIH